MPSKSAAFEWMNNDLARRSFLPSGWAVSSARGLAQFYYRLCGFDGQPPLLKKETLDVVDLDAKQRYHIRVSKH